MKTTTEVQIINGKKYSVTYVEGKHCLNFNTMEDELVEPYYVAETSGMFGAAMCVSRGSKEEALKVLEEMVADEIKEYNDPANY